MSGRWRPTVAEIDLGAIADNVRALRSLLAPGVRMLCVVKANAYGHGDVEVARACLGAGAEQLGVALVEEGVRLRAAGIDAPILVLVEQPPQASDGMVASGLTASVSTLESAKAMSEAAAAAGRDARVHLVVDTGMHREGAAPEDVPELAASAAGLPALEVEGLWSHLAVADEEESPQTRRQIERFSEVCAAVVRRGIEIPVRHLANSAGTIACPEAHLDMVRLGIAVYGLYPSPWQRYLVGLRPAMRLTSAVATVRRVASGDGVSYGHSYAPERDTVIASVPVGYGDGFTRLYSNRTEVLVGGRRRRVAGRVTMDQIMVDVGDDRVAPGDEVVLIGRQGDDEITADELASAVGTINYEVVCAIGSRVPRVYR